MSDDTRFFECSLADSNGLATLMNAVRDDNLVIIPFYVLNLCSCGPSREPHWQPWPCTHGRLSLAARCVDRSSYATSCYVT
jgi:hypothetical protein